MSELQVCEVCQRHIRVSESQCPFCDSHNASRSMMSTARTAVIAGALVGASALGCSDERPATKAPPPVKVTAAIDAAPASPIDAALPDASAADAGAADAGAADAAVVKKRKKKVKKEAKAVPLEAIERPPPPMPYGAPPARRRLV